MKSPAPQPSVDRAPVPTATDGRPETISALPPSSAGFRCTICGGSAIDHGTLRDDGVRVLFCAGCGMGVVEQRPADTAHFYTDDYYHRAEDSAHGYADYEFTAEHGLLWTRVLIERLLPTGGAVLDIGCATGFLLRRLGGAYRRAGIEANPAAARVAAAAGIDILGGDVLAPGLATAHAGAYDAIASIATYEHVLDIRAAIAASLEMLAPSGVLILEVPVISESRSNADWYGSSFEHIFYPTERGLRSLFALFPGVHFTGTETAIAGYSSTYIGLATRDPDRFAELQRLLAAMTADDPAPLTEDDARLNLAYTVLHEFRPTPARIIRLPLLLERYFSPNLGKRLMQLWYGDAVQAVDAAAAGVRIAAAEARAATAERWAAAPLTTISIDRLRRRIGR